MPDGDSTGEARGRLPAGFGTLAPDELLVHELFHSVQGESSHVGRPCFFVRLTGCHLRCSWCDTEHAFFAGERMAVAECLDRVERAGCHLVEVTGGEPLLQKGALPLLTGLCDNGHEVLLETSGALDISPVDPRVRRIVDWKAPGSGEDRHNRPSVLTDLRAGDELKVVIADRDDYEWARDWVRSGAEAWAEGVPVHFSPAWGAVDPADLAAWILADTLDVRLGLQLHKVLWGAEARGV